MLDLISAYENYLTKVKQASSNTISSYMRDIRQYAEWLRVNEDTDVVDATQLNISDYLSHLEEEGRSAATKSRTLASLKNFYAYVVSSGFLERTPVTEIKIDRGEKKMPQILTGREIELLLAQPACVDAKGYRDKAMLEVMYATGIRVTELIDLNLEDVNLDLKSIKGMGQMLGGFTVLRLTSMMGMANVSFTKEELLKMNKKLNRIKKPKDLQK